VVQPAQQAQPQARPAPAPQAAQAPQAAPAPAPQPSSNGAQSPAGQPQVPEPVAMARPPRTVTFDDNDDLDVPDFLK